METVTIDKQTIIDLSRMIEELQDKIESLELMSDSEFMNSLKESDEEVKNRNFANWDGL